MCKIVSHSVGQSLTPRQVDRSPVAGGENIDGAPRARSVLAPFAATDAPRRVDVLTAVRNSLGKKNCER